MNSTTLGIFTFFCTGVFIYVMARHIKPWSDKHQNLFWLAALSPLILTLFVLPGYVNKDILNGINAIVAGLAVSEYMRNKHKEKFERIKNFGQEVKQSREKVRREEKKRSKKTGRSGKDQHP